MKGKALKIVNLILAVFLALFSVGYAFAWFATSTSQKSGVTGSAGAYFASGSGTEADPFVITNAQHLSNLAALQAAGKLQQKYYFELGNDIDMSGRVVPPIGTADNPFMGDFDGNGHTVSGLVVSTNKSVLINRDVYSGVAFSNFVGMFGRTGKGSDIRNFILNNPVVEAASEDATEDATEGATYAAEEGQGYIVLGEGEDNSKQVSRAVGLAVGYIEHRASSIGVIGGVISAPRSGYNTFNGIIGAMSEEAGNSYDLGSDGNLGTIGNVGYFIPDIFSAAATEDGKAPESGGAQVLFKDNSTQPNMKKDKMLVSDNGAMCADGTSAIPMDYADSAKYANSQEYIAARWSEDAVFDFSTTRSLGLGVFTFVTGHNYNDGSSAGDMSIRGSESLDGHGFAYVDSSKTYIRTIDSGSNPKWEGMIRDLDGEYLDGVNDTFDLSWSFRYRAQSRSLGYNRADGETGKLDIIRVNDNMTNADGGTYSGFESTGKTLSADGSESSYNDGDSFDNFPTNALIFNTVLDNASIFVIHSSSPVYVLQILDGQTLVNRLRFKAAKELNDSGIDFTLYANFEQYAAADANAASYLESNYGHIDGSYFFMKYDYDILYGTEALYSSDESGNLTVNGAATKRDVYAESYTGDQILLNQRQGTDGEMYGGAGLYVMFSDSSNLNIQYVAVTGVAGEESADQPGIANAAVSGIDFIYDGVIITQEPVYSGATAIDAFAFAVQSGNMYERYAATATLVYITGNSSAAVILGFVRADGENRPLNAGYNGVAPLQTGTSAVIAADDDMNVTVSPDGAVVKGWPN